MMNEEDERNMYSCFDDKLADMKREIARLKSDLKAMTKLAEEEGLTISQIEYAYAVDREVKDAEIARLTQRVRELEAEFVESNGLLRSTYQIASRDGKDTNWEAFRSQVHIALVRQHEQTYPKEKL